MPLLHRRMKPADVALCAEAIAADPVLAPRYAGAIPEFQQAVLSLLDSEAVHPIIFEYKNGGATDWVGFGISAFVSEEFSRLIRTPPFVWAGRELALRLARGERPVLSEAELRERNTGDGLSLFVWMSWYREHYIAQLEVIAGVMTVFIDLHTGFRLNEVMTQADMVISAESTLCGGGMILSPTGEYASMLPGPAAEVVMSPHCFHIPRELAITRAGSWTSALFAYRPPKIFFNPSQQRLLRVAMNGSTDEELADDLGISLSGVKKTWRQIYERVADRLPELMLGSDNDDGERGRSKKPRLLAYLREHTEELRPLPRKATPQKA